VDVISVDVYVAVAFAVDIAVEGVVVMPRIFQKNKKKRKKAKPFFLPSFDMLHFKKSFC